MVSFCIVSYEDGPYCSCDTSVPLLLTHFLGRRDMAFPCIRRAVMVESIRCVLIVSCWNRLGLWTLLQSPLSFWKTVRINASWLTPCGALDVAVGGLCIVRFPSLRRCGPLRRRSGPIVHTRGGVGCTPGHIVVVHGIQVVNVVQLPDVLLETNL